MNKFYSKAFCLIILLSIAAILPACRPVYYSAMEKLGKEKRDLLIDRIEDALNSEKDAKEQFQTTLEKFSELTGFSGGDLEDTYKKLNSELEDSEDEAQQVKDHIQRVEQVAGDLFDEWEEELGQYHDRELRNKSRQSLIRTKKQYNELITSMKKAEKKIDPALVPLRDRVLFLKHNLNAKAIASLDTEFKSIKADISSLIGAIDNSIDEANRFLKDMKEE